MRSRKTSIEILDVFMNGVRVGKLERRSTGALYFAYDLGWLEREKPLPISHQFPLRESKYTGDAVRGYFENLLPDQRAVRQKLAARAGAKSTQVFDLLSSVGRDCVGALQFYPRDDGHPRKAQVVGSPVSEAEIAEILRGLRIKPLGITIEAQFRISLAGAQDKTALLWNDGRWQIPQGSTATTHILKPAIGALPDGLDLSCSVENEWLCLKICSALGLNSASAEMQRFEDLKTLVVTRFDRSWVGKDLYRLPQEDTCQALGIGPEKKYEADGGPGVVDIMKLLSESDARDPDRYAFMKAQVVFWLMAAVDGHGKNFSIFLRQSGFVMTPLYDVLSADPLVNPKTMPSQKIELAMAVGDGRHRRVQEIQPRHWHQTAKKAKFAEMDDVFKDLFEHVEPALESVQKELPRGFPAQVSEPIFEGMRKRLKRLKETAG